MTLRQRVVAVALSGMLSIAAAAAWAQPAGAQRVARPYRGLFGGGVGRSEQLLALHLSAGGGYDDDILAELGASAGEGADGRRTRGGSHTYVEGDLTYTLSRDRIGFTAGVAGAARHRPDLSQDFVGSYSANAGVFVDITDGTRLTASQSATYQPFYSFIVGPPVFEILPDAPRVPELAYQVTAEDYLTYATNVEISQTLSRRATVSAAYSYSRSDFASRDLDTAFHNARGRFSLGLTRDLALRLGYGYGRSTHLVGEQSLEVPSHFLDAGVDFDRALSLTRRMTLTFNAGSTAFVENEVTHYRLIGGARLNREIGRTWTASLGYDRNVGFTPRLPQPLLYDAVTLSVDGLVTRRISFYSWVSAASGNVGATIDDSRFNSYNATTGLQFALTRQLATNVEYLHYRHSFSSAVPAAGLPREAHRHSVRAYLTLWVPLLHRARRPDATR